MAVFFGLKMQFAADGVAGT